MFVIAQIQHIVDNINRLLGKVKITDGANDAEVFAHPIHGLKVAVVDADGDQITSFGGGGGDATAANQLIEIAALETLEAGKATSALQTAGNASLSSIAGEDFATQTTLASVLAKLDVALSTRAVETGGNLATIAGKDFATQTTLALMLTALTLMKDTDGIKKIVDAVAVTGEFWQATQPVSGTVAVTTLKPDGTNTAPSMDTVARAGWIQEKDNVPTATGKNNPSYVYTWVVGELTQIDMTIGATVYRKTLTWVASELTAISAWSVV